MIFLRRFFLLVLPLLLLTACAAPPSTKLPSGLERPTAEDDVAEPQVDFSRSKPDVQRYMRLGQQAEQGSNVQVAGMMYRAAAEADKTDAAPFLALAQLQERAGDSATASQLYETAAKKNPDDNELQLAAARNLLKQRNFALAAQRYEKQAERNGDWRAWNGLGVARGLMGNEQAARGAFAKALDRTPDAAKVKVRANLALSEIMGGDSRAAITLLEPLQAKGMTSSEETRLLALAYGFVGRVEDAQRLGLNEPPSPDILEQLRQQPDAPAITAVPRAAVERAVELPAQ